MQGNSDIECSLLSLCPIFTVRSELPLLVLHLTLYLLGYSSASIQTAFSSAFCPCKRKGLVICIPQTLCPELLPVPLSYLPLHFAALYLFSDVAGYWGRLMCAVLAQQLFLVLLMLRAGL